MMSFSSLFPITIMVLLSLPLAESAHAADAIPIYRNTSQPFEARVEDLLARMTLEEKVSIIAGDPATHFDTRPIERLGIPRFSMADGPHGIRDNEPATSFPVGVNMAATWDTDLIERLGHALAVEARAKGRNVLLGPCINLHRTPFGGRNFESFSEDPYLTGVLAVAYVKGVQAEGVVAVPKHFAANNQEENRRTIDVRVNERALREIYFPPFKMALQEGGAWAVMGSYNRVNGRHASQDPYLLTTVLKEEWGFDGMVMSDWLAVHDTVKAGNSGLDLEMPCEEYFGKPLIEAVEQRDVPLSAVEDKARRVLRTMFLSGVFDRGGDSPHRPVQTTSFEDLPDTSNPIGSAAHRALALQVAQESIVLLKNTGHLLPLDRDRLGSIAVIGPNAAIARLGGSGSSVVKPVHAVSPLEGIMKKTVGRVNVRYSQGCGQDSTEDFFVVPGDYLRPPDGEKGPGLLGQYFDTPKMDGTPALQRVDPVLDLVWGYDPPGPGLPADSFSARWTGTLTPPVTGEYRLAVVSDDAYALFLDGQCIAENDRGWNRQQVRAKSVHLQADRDYDIRLDYVEKGDFASVKLGWIPPGGPSIAHAVDTARDADVAVVVVGLNPFFVGEGHDRESLALPGPQAELIRAVHDANPRTIVVLNSGTPFLPSPWIDDVPVLLETFFPGEEGGQALADILFGDVSPSGRLPFTWPYRWEDCPAHGNYPGTDEHVNFEEGIFIGYRFFDAKNKPVRFAFGHGLTYSRFEYTDLTVKAGKEAFSFDVSLKVANAGGRTAADVVQLYLTDEDAGVERPAKELRGFRKIHLAPGEKTKVAFTLTARDFAFFDPTKSTWKVEAGRFSMHLGPSSRDIRLSESCEFNGDTAWTPNEKPGLRPRTAEH